MQTTTSYVSTSDQNIVATPYHHTLKFPESSDPDSLATDIPEKPQNNESTNTPSTTSTDEPIISKGSSNSSQSDNTNNSIISSETTHQEDKNTPSYIDGPKEYWFESSYYGQSQEIVDQGYMVEWVDNWFVVHWYTDYGKQIQELQPNDIVHINGRTVIIYGSFDIAYESYVEEIREEVGNDKVLFQTCYGPHQPTMLVQYGYYV